MPLSVFIPLVILLVMFVSLWVQFWVVSFAFLRNRKTIKDAMKEMDIYDEFTDTGTIKLNMKQSIELLENLINQGRIKHCVVIMRLYCAHPNFLKKKLIVTGIYFFAFVLYMFFFHGMF